MLGQAEPLPETQQSDVVSRPLATFTFGDKKKRNGSIMMTERGDICVVVDGKTFPLHLLRIADWGIKQWRRLKRAEARRDDPTV